MAFDLPPVRIALYFTLVRIQGQIQHQRILNGHHNRLFSLWSYWASPLRGFTIRPTFQTEIPSTGELTFTVRGAVTQPRALNEAKCRHSILQTPLSSSCWSHRSSPWDGRYSRKYNISLPVLHPRADLYSMHTIHKRREPRYLNTFRGELIGLFILWIFWICGAAIASVRLPFFFFAETLQYSY